MCSITVCIYKSKIRINLHPISANIYVINVTSSDENRNFGHWTQIIKTESIFSIKNDNL